jgi:ABC-2 type transport system ATP-binding protein
LTSAPLLDLRNVSFAYGSHPALRDVTLRLEPGAIGIVGNNGAGKSTLLKILLGLLTPTAGAGEVLGRPLGGGCELRGLVGYLSETTAVVPLLGGAEFVALSGELYGMPLRDAFRRAHEMLDYVGLGELRYRRLDEYSTGSLQRLKLAAALVHDPQLLLLDEPTNGLDPAGRAAMLRLIEDLIAETGKSVLLCTHLLVDVERVCRQIVVMHRGTVAQAGTIESLRRHTASRFAVTWQGERGSFIEALEAAGATIHDAPANGNGAGHALAVSHDRHTTTIALPDGSHSSLLFQTAHRHGATIVELRPEHEDLEQLFFRLTQPEPAHAP